MVVREIGQDKILTQAAGLAVEDCYPQIIKENNLEPLGPPKVDILKLALDNPLEFRAEIFVLPEITLPDYKKIAGQIKKQDIVVEDKIIFSNGSYCFPSFLSVEVFSGSTKSNKKFTLSVLCVSAVNYYK